jgi:hypothetical protein
MSIVRTAISATTIMSDGYVVAETWLVSSERLDELRHELGEPDTRQMASHDLVDEFIADSRSMGL